MKSALAALLFLLPALAFAQVGTTDGLSLTVTPENPHPGDTITITPQSGTIPISNATMIATLNGKQVYSGNAQAFSVTLPPVGSSATIKVTVTGEGASVSQSLTFKPGDVSLVVEPASSAPALYLGKPLIPIDGSVRVIAVADLRTSPASHIDSSLLSYAWQVDGNLIASASGIGRSSIIIESPLEFRSTDVSVTVQTRDGSISGSDSVTLAPQNPTVRIYQDDPLLGAIFDTALSGNFSIAGSEATFIAVPYSFALTNGLTNLQWFVNGSASQAGNAITLRPSGNGQGGADLSVTAAKDTGDNQASASLSLTFGQKGGLFGL